jgi:HEPN superfamily protein
MSGGRMIVDPLEFPAPKEWRQIYEASCFNRLLSVVDKCRVSGTATTDWNGLMKAVECRSLLHELRQRLADVGRCYVFMMLYYQKGIPDDPWAVSPGANGESIQFYPRFEDRHFPIKAWFDFYSDTLYYKLFSAWDVVGHIIDVTCDLTVKNVDFDKAVAALGKSKKAEVLHDNLAKIRDSEHFKQAKDIRNNITHNYLPNTTGLVVERTANRSSIITKKYLPSRDIVENIEHALGLFESTLLHMSTLLHEP